MPPPIVPKPVFGTAPHMLLPGVWVTLGGRHLTPAGNAYWTRQFQLGAVDRYGHYNRQVGNAIRQAHSPNPTIARQGGKVVGAEAKRQQQQIERQGADAMAWTPLGPAFQIAHGIRHHDPLDIGLGAMAILPGGKLIKPIREGVDAVRAVGLADKAAPEARVIASLDAASRGHAIKAALQSEERARRFAKSRVAFEAAGGGTMGHAAAKAELRGALPTVHFSELSTLSDEQLGYLHNVVDKLPDFLPGEKISLSEALKNAQVGVNPRPYEIDLMKRAFGSEVAAEFGEQKISAWRHALDLINIPRAIMTAFDLSGGLRQNLVALVHRPGIVSKEFGKSVRYLWSKDAYNARMAEIEADPMFPIFESHGGKLTDLGRNVAQREEYFPSKAAEKIPGIKGSGRAFTGLSNATRFLVWKDMYQGALASGAFEKAKDVEQLQKQLVRFAGIATGRGGLGKLEKIAPELNTVLFAPRLISSRIQMLTWAFNKNLDPYVRRQHLLALSKLIGAGTAFLTALAYAGAKVGLDPRSSDFGKAKFGNVRIDLWGGHQQYVRVMAQVLSKTYINSQGEKIPLKGGFARSRLDVLKRFGEQKLSPPAGFIDAWANGSDVQGRPFSVKRQLAQDAWPLVAQDAVHVAQQTHSPLWGVGAYALAGLGVGVQAFGPNPPKTRTRGFHRAPIGRSNSGSPDWFGGGSSGGGTDLFGSSSGGGGTDLFAP